MIEELTEFQKIQLITTIVNKHGCEIIEIDLENHIIDISGSPESRLECARELEAFLN